MAKICVLLSGCGKNDGAEIHESVLALLAIDKAGATYDICAPDVDQMDVVNHHTDEISKGDLRNARVESARIARGPVRDVADVKAEEFDALIMPGGFGAAKNLSDFAVKGVQCTVNAGVANLVRGFRAAGKPIGAICIAPAVVAKILGEGRLTIGNDTGTAEAINSTGSCHVDCAVGDIVIDDDLNLVSTPAYMLATRISEVNEGIGKLVNEIVQRASRQQTAG